MERMPSRTEDVAARLRRGMVAALAVGAILSACAAPGGGAGATQSGATAAPPSAAPGTPSGQALQLQVAQDATLGAYVTGRDGMALYIFTKDSGSTSACTGDCAKSWPPVIVTMADDATAGSGVTGSLGTTSRDDGTLQLTLGGHPLYYFANDKAAGDVNGQGLNDVWFLAGPDGTGVGMEDGGGAAATPCPPASRTCY